MTDILALILVAIVTGQLWMIWSAWVMLTVPMVLGSAMGFWLARIRKPS